MSFWKSLFGGGDKEPARQGGRVRAGESSEEERAIERYRYLLRTAPPEDIERAHAEAFAQMTPEQRAAVLRELSAQVPEGERTTADDPQSLARLATRTELRQPGTLERTLGAPRATSGMGMGSMFATTMLGSIAGYVVGSAIAQTFFDHDQGFGGDAYQDASAMPANDAGAWGDSSVDAGGDFGDFGGGE